VTQSAIRTVAFLGTGLMGAPMIQRLLGAGIGVKAWNRTPDKLRALTAAGAIVAETPAAAADGVDAICLCLANVAAAESVLFGKNGVASVASKQSLIVDFSTIGPKHTADFAARLHSHESHWVDAPVSGGVPGATQGKLVVFCGGRTQDVERLRDVFAALAQRVTHVGDVGAGQTMKLCNQLIVSSNIIAIAEAIALARAGGIDAGTLPSALAGGFADSIPLQVFGGRMAAGVTQPILGALALMLKDATAIGELAAAEGQRLPLSAATLAVYEKAAAAGLINQDLSAIMELYRA
jgi:3-hydroxyisobutyrate dehydrogenase-like beta-hydroxyacid dehydrogenase